MRGNHQQQPPNGVAADAGSDAELAGERGKVVTGGESEGQLQQQQQPADKGSEEQQQRQQQAEEEAASPFACIASTMGWGTFHLVRHLHATFFRVGAKPDLWPCALKAVRA